MKKYIKLKSVLWLCGDNLLTMNRQRSLSRQSLGKY